MTLKHLLPARVIIDDTGGPDSGWPCVAGSVESDVTLIHYDGFHQEFWGDLSMKDAVKLAHFIVDALNNQ